MPKRHESYYQDLIGKKMGKLTILSTIKVSGSKTKCYCLCECGNTTTVALASFNYGHIKSCSFSCGNTTHGMTKTPEYDIWQGMKRRCLSIDKQEYEDYWGKGIRVCEGWLNSFETFFADMGNRPSKNHSIDRVKNDGNYSCGHCQECLDNQWDANCRWATQAEQHFNRRNTIFLTALGKTMTLGEWAEEVGLHINTIKYRRYHGYSDYDAIFSKVKRLKPWGLKTLGV